MPDHVPFTVHGRGGPHGRLRLRPRTPRIVLLVPLLALVYAVALVAVALSTRA
ncbi:hypothetical protein [Nocardioides sp. GY 10127]|uniref:hypothetical protein n=1 Tax=Nocardioides sp. GY 10127 TaxID=2569762 RepID=UPI001458A5D0|nr:hypothetical protein [Nocardioides sp. GY 10127]